jgi:GLPGLI family protein
MPNAAGKITTIADTGMNDVIILMNLQGKKFAMKKTADDIKKAQVDLAGVGNAPVITVTKSDETKLIAGYTCKKATIHLKYGETTLNNICWYTDKLPK